MLKRSLSPLFLVIALIIGYGIEWGPYYVSLVSGGELKVLGRLPQWRVDCPKSNLNGNRCADRYSIPAEVLHDFGPEKAIGFGMAVYATEVSCTGESARRMVFGDLAKPGRVMDITTCYQRADFDRLACRAGVTLDTWSPAHFRRHGYGGSSVVVGSPFLVERVGKLAEFFLRTLPNILAALLVGVYCINASIRSVSFAPTREIGFERYLLAWIVLCVVGSGIAQVVIPWAPEFPIFARVWNACDFIAHFGSGMGFMAECALLPFALRAFARQMTPRRVVAIGALFGVLPWFGVGLAPLIVTLGVLHLLAGIKGRSPLLVCFALAIFADSARLFNFNVAPHFQVALVFAFLSIGASFVTRILKTARLMDAVRWARGQIESLENRELHDILAEVSRYFDIPRVVLVDGKGHPEPRWHARTEGGGFITILPVVKNGRRLAAIAMGGYGESLVVDDERRLSLVTAMEMLLPFLADSLASQALTEEKARVESALAGFVPKTVMRGLIDGTETRVSEQGFLLMADLKDSTRISRAIGAEPWVKIVRGLAGPVEEIAGRHGYVLQSIVWDGFYLTRATAATSNEVAQATALANELRQFFSRIYKECFGRLEEYPARFCLVHGDISRGLSPGVNQSWTIVGTAMAEVSKLEQVCKRLPGWLFASHSAFAGEESAPQGWTPLDVAVHATGEPIFAHAA